MANSAYTTTSSLSDSLNVMVASARNVREYTGVMTQLVERQRLAAGTGTDWKEVTFAKLTAQAVTETTVLDNPQQLTDTAFTLRPSKVGIHTFITDEVKARMATIAFARLGQLAQDAIERKKDTDGLILLDGFSSLGGAGTTATTGLVAAAQAQISGNTTEPGMPPYAGVFHPYQIKDFFDELVAGIGTYPVPEGPTAQVFKTGFKLPVANVDIFPDGNLSIDSSDDAKGGVFCKQGIVLVEGLSPYRKEREEPHIGGGGTSVWLYDQYIFGERLGAGTTSVWGKEIYTDASAPTS